MHLSYPNADKFQDWLCADVLPEIRKTGSYISAKTFQVPQTLPEALRAYADTLEVNAILVEDKKQLEHQVEEQQPKVEIYDALMSADDQFSIGYVAKALGVSGLFEILRREDVLMGLLCGRNHPDWNVPYKRYVDAGYFKVKTTPITHTDSHPSIIKLPWQADEYVLSAVT